ncbi:sulfotransferase family protein [Cochleicola gelatinilyticus]|uniref:Sulfotransferase n=1 Tax=Cochleicola gelatinilyticus TaxID=1763537 RepID=A0A167EPK3_9FLAO|nr:sulfotransferase [Cochleicola gelatinilyticus]OAB75749.1 hypothetical protein ULVI_14840 [Cochleicola gelatinilyticus]
MIFSKFKKKLIFVIGSGRSGTHLLGRTFGNSPEIETFIEEDKFFLPITELAAGLNKNASDFDDILSLYKKEFKKSKKKYILEKTHPNIWFVEKIHEYFPKAQFIGIKRNVYATVASMLNHDGVLSWYKRIPLDEENSFLGINRNNLKTFKDLPLESKCAIRWKAHVDRLDYLSEKFPEHVLVINYEDFYDRYPDLMNELKAFLDTDFEIHSEPLNVKGKDKWREQLTDKEIENIDKAIRV